MAIEQIVVLMLENRSFDHMLGYARSVDFPVDGLTGVESNYLNPVTHAGTPVTVSPTATYVPDQDPSPGHDFGNVAVQLHGASPPPVPPVGSNVGFVADYATVAGAARAGEVMRCHAGGRLPVLETLAREYAVCDAWFSSMPGPTWPNRLFAHCATSGGFVDGALRSYNMRTLYENLSAAGVDWRVYYHDMPQSLALANLRKFFRSKYELFNQAFERDCRDGRLPRYSFIEPRYFNEGSSRANDQHPIHGVVGGELLIAQVYEAIRSSPQWPQILLIVTWDEHGGFYDHVQPHPATPPDDATTTFNFASYGVRVPAIAVSALIPRGTVDHTVYDHASIPATAKKIFGLPNFLTRRDAAANTLERLCSLEAPRGADAPRTVPRPSPDAVAAAAAASGPDDPPNDLQHELLDLARSLGLPIGVTHIASMAQAATEQQAATEVQAHLDVAVTGPLSGDA
jgi:phospholipase C